jgi:hypothetical protein
VRENKRRCPDQVLKLSINPWQMHNRGNMVADIIGRTGSEA